MFMVKISSNTDTHAFLWQHFEMKKWLIHVATLSWSDVYVLLTNFPNRSLIEARLRMLPLQQRHGGREERVKIISHPKTDESSFFCRCHRLWVKLFMCLSASSDKHVAVSQQPVCLWQWGKPQGRTCLWIMIQGLGTRKKEEDRKQLSGRFSAVTLSVCGKDKEAALQNIAGK